MKRVNAKQAVFSLGEGPDIFGKVSVELAEGRGEKGI
jgi:hypothetical protein